MCHWKVGRKFTTRSANVNFTWHEFNGQHAFIRDEGHRYDPALALQCYQMALELFHRRLGEGDLPVAPSGPAESKTLIDHAVTDALASNLLRMRCATAFTASSIER